MMEDWRGVGDACRDNGRDLATTAHEFEAAGKIGRAYTFTVLAWEELAKCLIYRMVEIGIMSFDVEDPTPGALIRIDPHVLTRHRDKHQMILLTLIGGEYVDGLQQPSIEPSVDPATVTSEELAQVTPAMISNAFPERIRPDRLKDLPKEIDANEAFKTGVLALAKEKDRWDRLKNRGLYVGNGKSGIELPSSVTQSELESLKHLFGLWTGFNEKVIDGFPANFVDTFRKNVMTLYSPKAVGMTKVFYCEQCATDIKKGRRKPLGS